MDLKPWNLLDHLTTVEDIAAFLRAATEEAGDDPASLISAIDSAATALERLGSQSQRSQVHDNEYD